MAKRPPVLVVEDDPGWQNIFAEIITDVGLEPVVASSYVDAVNLLMHQTFALALVDISLSQSSHKDQSGVKILRKITNLPTRLPAIVITGHATVELAVETLADLHAAHFFRKQEFDRRKFIKIIQKETQADNPLLMLTLREQEVLELMSQGYTNKEIADSLTVSVNTIKKHAQNIFTKLNVESRAAAVARVFKGSE